MTGLLFAKVVASLQSDSTFKPELMLDSYATMPKKSKQPRFNYEVVNQYRNKLQMGNMKVPLELENVE